MSSESTLEVPRYLRSPGEEGFRTPTIEDAVRVLEEARANQLPGADRGLSGIHSSALEAALQKATSRGTDHTHKLDEYKRDSGDSDEMGEQYHGGGGLARRNTDASAKKLSWKKRIRHITWAYFTLTMATGGMANVLYTGQRACPGKQMDQPTGEAIHTPTQTNWCH